MNRRTFVRAMAEVAGAAHGMSAVACRSRPSPAALPPGERINPIGIQLYSVRRSLARDFDRTLARLAAIGYREVEFAGYHERTPEDVRRTLDRQGLVAPSSHVTIDIARQDWARALDAARLIGHQYLIIPWLPEEDRRSVEQLRRVAAELNRLGEVAGRAGVHLGYHNHDSEFVPLDGRVPYDILLAETDPGLVAFELDLMWISRAGRDPLEYFARYPGRFALVHVKDSTGAPTHRHVDVGKGTIDFGRILPVAWDAGVRHFLVEHDDPTDEIAFARASYDYLARLSLNRGPPP